MNTRNLTERATILVVDDTPDNLTLMSNLLKRDYKVKVADCGEKALQIAASEAAPDLILLDVMMPGMDGYEVCQRLKDDPQTRSIPVIFLSAKAGGEDERRGLELGAEDYITKPICAPIVMARVKNHLALKAMEDCLRENNRALENARSLAEQANRAKSEFLSSMSHELRSPLNAILGFAQLLDSDTPPPTPAQRTSLAHILQAGWHLLTLINEILDIAKIESGQVAMALEPVPLADVMHECQTMMAPQAQQRGIHIAFSHVDTPGLVMADRTRLKQILINLLSNAIKYNRKSGTVEVMCTARGMQGLRISIKDSGAGLSAEQVGQLFQPFNRLGQEKGAEEGTGIGLVVVKRLVELMGGVVGVESIVGVGSVFWFELPCAAEPRLDASGTDDAACAQASAPPGDRLNTLLYVEDNSANLELVEQIIARHPHLRLLTAVNGTLGLERARKQQPEVILMDINLPGINGLEALNQLRSDPSTAHIPVIAISANAMARDIRKGLQAGFFHYLTKPIKVNEFMATLELAFKAARPQRGLAA